MLKPAVLYKEQLEKLFTEVIYTDDYLYYNGYAHEHELPKIGLEYGAYQFAIIDPTSNDVVGFLAYRIDTSVDSVYNFGLISFQKGNLTVVNDALHEFKQLVLNHKRVEWRCVEGNPASRLYDVICKKHHGKKYVLHDVCMSLSGKVLDSYLYEIRKGYDHEYDMEQTVRARISYLTTDTDYKNDPVYEANKYADYLLCDFVRSLGYTEIADAYDAVKKQYPIRGGSDEGA